MWLYLFCRIHFQSYICKDFSGLKRYAFILVLTAIAVSSCGTSRRSAAVESPSSVSLEGMEGRPQFAPRTLIVMYDEKVGDGPLKEAFKEYGAEIKYEYGLVHAFAIVIPEGKDIKEAMGYFKEVEGVLSVERDRIIYLDDPVRPVLKTM